MPNNNYNKKPGAKRYYKKDAGRNNYNRPANQTSKLTFKNKIKNWWRKTISSYRFGIEASFKFSMVLGYLIALVFFAKTFFGMPPNVAPVYDIYLGFLVQGLLIGGVIFTPFFILIMLLAIAAKFKKKEVRRNFILRSLRRQIMYALLFALVGMIVVYFDYSNLRAYLFDRLPREAMCASPMWEYVCLFSTRIGEAVLTAGLKIFSFALSVQLIIFGIYKGLSPLINSDEQRPQRR